MEIKEKMSDFGWHVSSAGCALLTDDGTITNINTIATKALNVDIRDFGEAALGPLLKQNRIDKIILQIQKIRNIAAPKSKEDSQLAPRMLKLLLTDGHTTCQAIEISNIPFLSRSHTPPGSKLLVNGAKITSSCILLHPNCCQLLGGRVPTLYERWELVKNISQSVRPAGSDGPPPWVNFGEKIITPTSNEPFKSLADKITKEATNEFDVHRQDAISTATTGAVKKIFGGGTNQQLPFNNPVKKFHNQEFSKPRHLKGFKSKSDTNEKVDKQQKPQEKLSLFEFLEDKLPVNQADDKHEEKVSPNYSNFNQTQSVNNISKFNDRNKPYNFNKPNKGLSAYNQFSNTNSAGYQNNTNHINELSNNMTKVSLDTQFAARSLKQHLNLHPSRKPNDNSTSSAYNWKIGDRCMAKYWEDGKYYNAIISNLTQNTCVVSFNGYGNIEEVLKLDCIPLSIDDDPSNGVTSNPPYKKRQGTREYNSNRRPYSSRHVNDGNYYYKS